MSTLPEDDAYQFLTVPAFNILMFPHKTVYNVTLRSYFSEILGSEMLSYLVEFSFASTASQWLH